MNASTQRYGVRRVYETRDEDGLLALRLKDRIVQLGRDEYAAYSRLADSIRAGHSDDQMASDSRMGNLGFQRFVTQLEEAGLLYRRSAIPASMSGEQLHADVFSAILPSWLSEAFSHPFWDRMMSGRGSARLFTGWMIELYHYTRNANRHMPLSCAYARSKPIKGIRARHYAEEWNHYHYFLKSLRALGHADRAIAESIPLPMTLAISNFMRQAAREDVLAYSICSAVLEGTTTERTTYNTYYEKAKELYGIPAAAIQPIYDHLALDIQYTHSDLFHEILATEREIPAARAARVLDYGHQLVEHIWMWTDSIERYYGASETPVPRPAFDPTLD